MNTKNIFDFFENDSISNKHFIGVFARDELPKKINGLASFIVNTDNSNKSGEHWLSFYFDEDGVCYFFDPLGFSPKYNNFEIFIKQNCKKYFYNDQRIQSLFSTNCGYFCCLFIYKKSRNYSFEKFLNLFFKDCNLNENLINIMKKNKFFK